MDAPPGVTAETAALGTSIRPATVVSVLPLTVMSMVSGVSGGGEGGGEDAGCPPADVPPEVAVISMLYVGVV